MRTLVIICSAAALCYFDITYAEDLNVQQRELKSEVLALAGQALDMSGPVENMGGAPIDLAAKDLAIKETETELKVELSGDILFDFDKWTIRKEAESSLQHVGELIHKYPKAKIKIDGYTDSKGDDNYNLKLSQKRADSVKTWMVANAGLISSHVDTKGFGEKNPVADNINPDGSDNPAGRQKNRRVEITVKK